METRFNLGGIVVSVVLKDIKNVHLSVYPPSGSVRIAAPRRMSIDTIRVNAISPALVRTRLTERSQQNPEILDYLRQRQPLAQGMMEADEIARAAVFLLSDESRMITGDTLTIDAGWSVSS